jgi:hypothetical protein
MTSSTIILIGVGEMGSVFARGFLRTGHTVVPVTRQQSASDVAEQTPQAKAVLIAVGEKDLPAVLQSLPTDWQDKAILLQNELLPRDWQTSPAKEPTVISVWFEKKQGQEAKVIVPSPAYGAHAQLLHNALGSLDIPVNILNNADALLLELVLKNLYIVTTNVAGLKVGGTVGELWQQHQDFARSVASEVLDIQESLCRETLDREALINGMARCFEGDPQHKCMGRSAPGRLQRALQQAEEAGLTVTTLKSVDSAVS